MRPDLQLLEARLGHTFEDRDLLIRALTHRSHASGKKQPGDSASLDNEQMEFLGDSVLGLLVSECLVRQFPTFSEGRLSKLKAHLVSASHLHEVACGLDLGRFLHLGRGEEMSGGRAKRTLLADALEAVIAALYLEGGIEPARRFVTEWIIADCVCLESASDGRAIDYKGALQERARALGLPQPKYVITQETGPEHAKTFVLEVRTGEWSGAGQGPSKKAAGQMAAKAVLECLAQPDATPAG
ncbi:MAG: ribonuclease III [Bryobacteraceae bacterium]